MNGPHAMAFSATKPKPIAIVEVTDISHSMPDFLAIDNLMKGILIGSSDITARDNWSTHHELSDLTSIHVSNLIDRFDGPSSIAITFHSIPENR